MTFLSHIKIELNRLFQSKITWLILLLTILCTFIGARSTGSTTAEVYLANPVRNGCIYGAFLFCILTLYELNRVKKYHMDILLDTILSPLTRNLIKLLSFILIAFFTTALTALVYLPYALVQLHTIFNIQEYVKMFGLLMFPSLLMGLLSASAFYQIFYRVDLSFVSFLAFALFSMGNYCSDLYLMRWINPLVPAFSSVFTNDMIYRTVSYNRRFWLSIIIGLWIFSLLFIRTHGKNLIQSFLCHIKKAYIPLIAITLIANACRLYIMEPYIDHAELIRSDEETSSGDYVTSTYEDEDINNETLLLTKQQADLKIHPAKGFLSGHASYTIENLSSNPDDGTPLFEDCVLDINPGYQVKKIIANGNEIEFIDLQNDYFLSCKDVTFTLPAEQFIQLEIFYEGTIQIPTSSRGSFMGSSEITANHIELGSNELCPLLHIDYSDQFSTTYTATLPEDMIVISKGKNATILSENNNHTKTWEFYGSMMVAGEYVQLKIDNDASPVYFYYAKNYQKQFDELDIDTILTDTIKYCTNYYGALPYTEEYPFNIVMGNALLMGGYVVDNISYIGESIFSAESLNDPLKGANASEIIAHEIVHQWWGVQKYLMDFENPYWTSEGFTVYTTYRMMKDKYGDAYATKYYIDVWNENINNMMSHFYIRNPEYQTIVPEKYLYQIQNMVQNTNTYCLVPIQILKAQELVGGEQKMDEILMDLYHNGGSVMPLMITWQDFLDACELTEEQLRLKEGDTIG